MAEELQCCEGNANGEIYCAVLKSQMTWKSIKKVGSYGRESNCTEMTHIKL